MTVAKVLNIEVGDRVTKICVSEKNKKGYQISNSFLMQTPVGAVRDGQIIAIDVMALALREALVKNGVSGVKNVTFTLSSTKVASREVMLPPVKDNRIKDVVETNKSDYFPVDMSGYCIAHTLLERVESGDHPGCRVQVTAAPRPLLEGYAALAEAAGLLLDAIDYCGNSQYQVLQSLPGEDIVMYVDVNVSNTLVTFMQNGIMMMQRNINFGGDELVSTVMEAAGKDNDEFLTVLEQSNTFEYLDQHLPRSQQEACLSRLIGGISRSADFFKSNRSAVEISKVVLMGVCSDIAGLKDLVQHALDTEAVSLQDVEEIKNVANSVGGVNAYISCIGSLLNPLSLLPEELRGVVQKKKNKRERKSDSIKAGVIICVLLSVLGVGLAGFAVFQYKSAQNEQARLEQRIQELDHVRVTAETYENYMDTEAALNQIRGYSQTHNASLVSFLEELEREMPTSMLLLSAVCDEEGVVLNIVTPGMEEADVVISQLRQFESIKHMEVSTITESNDEVGLASASFSVRCGYNAPEAEAPAAAAPVEDTVE